LKQLGIILDVKISSPSPRSLASSAKAREKSLKANQKPAPSDELFVLA